MIIDSGSDYPVARNYDWISKVTKVDTVSTKGFSNNHATIINLRIANIIYAYDHSETGDTLLLNANYCMYVGNQKEDSVVCLN